MHYMANFVADSKIVDDDFPTEIVERHHVITKRSASFDDDLYDPKLHEDIPQEYLRRSRNTDWSSGYTKRSNEFFIKVLVVADSTMLEYHKSHEELTKYILILMSHVRCVKVIVFLYFHSQFFFQVSLLFKEASIGNAINVSVVHIEILGSPMHDFSNSLSQGSNIFTNFFVVYVAISSRHAASFLRMETAIH